MPEAYRPHRKLLQLRWLLIISSVLLLAGLFLPMLTISQFVVIRNEFSVISGISELWKAGQYVLFVVIGCFSVVVPMAKVALLFKLLQSDNKPHPIKMKLLRLMHDYGRWAMLDVMVVAMLIVTVKMGAIASIQIHPGLYVFGAAVLLIMLTTQSTVRLLENQQSDSNGSAQS
ncbi:paraquat-inducible protein A [uncultured Methylophaga sp.]|uniref:paraquat-inducible protein A n=1 Tax=uncultured Methylophaga sp. TaxID=285271 RepID=UPI002624020F|nr:paraquat-inducible protein A [uncultured Methylophaga sp.]